MSLKHFKNYYVYGPMLEQGKSLAVYVPKDITINNIDDHIEGITNILKDSIELESTQNMRVRLSWDNGRSCKLKLVDYWFSLFMWTLILKTGQEILPKHIFFQKELKRKNIKKYVDKFILNKDILIKIPITELNSIICDGLWNYSLIEPFSLYLANTINNEDDIDLMKASPEFNDIIHCSMQGVPFDQVKDKGMELTYRAIDIIKNSEIFLGYEHALTNSFRASEAINPRQYKEASINIGTKTSYDTVYPYIIDKSYKTGGVNDLRSFLIENNSARTAQIMSKKNVGDSGDFARILGLNNMDTILNPNRLYECMTRHFVRYEIKSKDHLSMIKNRYYRNTINGIEYAVNDEDESMVGKTIYLKSPMKCASNSSGHGICKKCYGDLYYVNYMINVGKIAAEILSSQLTQKLLSAKHLLETYIKKMKWNTAFETFFNIDINSITLCDDNFIECDLNKFTMIIDPDDVVLVDDDYSSSDNNYISDDDDENEDNVVVDEESSIYNEYITRFIIRDPEGNDIEFGTEDQDQMYISNELNQIIRRKAKNTDGMINIPLGALTDTILFYVKINNNEFSKIMNQIINIINKSSVTSTLTADTALQSLVDAVVDGGVTIDSVHLETILSNQIVSKTSMLKRPNWNDPEAQYTLLTLNQALTNNPSIIVSLLYKDLHKILYNPLSFQKHAPSFFDLFFVEDPQNYMSDELLVDKVDIRDPEKRIIMAHIVDKDKE